MKAKMCMKLWFSLVLVLLALSGCLGFGKIRGEEQGRLGRALWDKLPSARASNAGARGEEVSPNRLNRHILGGEKGAAVGDDVRRWGRGVVGTDDARSNLVASDEDRRKRKREALKALLTRRMVRKRLQLAMDKKKKVRRRQTFRNGLKAYYY